MIFPWITSLQFLYFVANNAIIGIGSDTSLYELIIRLEKYFEILDEQRISCPKLNL